MSTTTKSKLYLLIIVILLASNIALLFLFLNKGGKKGGRGDRGVHIAMFLKNEIGFTESQIKEYEELSQLHKEKMKSRFDQMKSSKQNTLKYLGANGFTDSAINVAALKNAENQKQAEQEMFTHIATIRKICTPQQMPKFDSLIYKIWDKRKK